MTQRACGKFLILVSLLVALLLTTSTALASSGQDIADYANSGDFLGIRYVKNGMSTSGFDCSGFVCYVYLHFGIDLPHYTGDLKEEGTVISEDGLKAGDLVFFRNWHHVGIYLGNGNFIHASSGSGEVVISTLLEGYYYEKYSGARRIL